MRPTAFLPLVFAPLALAQSQSAPQCQPTDVDCFVDKAQYTVLGSVLGNNIGQSNSVTGVTGTEANYNATIRIQCVYASTDPVANNGQNILGKDVLVTGFGTSRRACPNGGGATANATQSNIFFLFVANTPPKGETPILSVFDICTGGLTYNDPNLSAVGQVLAQNPQRAFYGSARGPSDCKINGLPQDAAPTPSSAATVPTSTSAANNLPGAASNVKASWVGSIIAGAAAIAGAVLA
ncbi:hypothetical protein HK097_008364 [Rhizophlyctis rosea]|uniref:Uncharacterized protein n=1 Tax=Rhizophlyctis rosea TaxID=64517 RepID=A0AAD5X7V6_9FUNG|nr:hypothetical protein HK097_008364 [Rhizophlyctis rosea]